MKMNKKLKKVILGLSSSLILCGCQEPAISTLKNDTDDYKPTFHVNNESAIYGSIETIEFKEFDPFLKEIVNVCYTIRRPLLYFQIPDVTTDEALANSLWRNITILESDTNAFQIKKYYETYLTHSCEISAFYLNGCSIKERISCTSPLLNNEKAFDVLFNFDDKCVKDDYKVKVVRGNEEIKIIGSCGYEIIVNNIHNSLKESTDYLIEFVLDCVNLIEISDINSLTRWTEQGV